jgi:hypothetical protein
MGNQYITYLANRRQIINIEAELFLIKYLASLHYEPAAKIWNEIDPEHRSFKKDGSMFFCELIPEVTILEETENNK